jgi:outer membrane protein OmpU
MTPVKKVGLTALAGSLVAFSAQALEMSVSGSAKITYVDEGEGSAGNTDVTGNPYGFDQALAFNGSGDSDIGTVSVMHVLNVNGPATSSSLITIDMGDAGKISLDGGVGNSGAGTYKDMLPRAAGIEQSWDDTDGDAYFIDTPSQGNWGYDNTYSGIDVTLSYAKNGGGNSGDDANTDAGDDSSKSIGVKTSTLSEGLTVGAAIASTDSTTSTDSDNESTAFATYAVGPMTVGLQMSEINTAGADATSLMYGVAININENASVSFNQRDVELGDGTGATKDQEDTGIGASYTMGSMTVSAFNNASDNVGGTEGKEDEVTQVTLSFAF